MSNPRFLLTLEALPNRGPVDHRLRAALKDLLRAYGFRCVRCVEIQEEQDGEIEGGQSENVSALPRANEGRPDVCGMPGGAAADQRGTGQPPVPGGGTAPVGCDTD